MATYDHWLSLHIGDYVADTMHLNATQHGAYLLLIMHYFKRRELPDDERGLAQIARLRIDHWRRISPPIMALFYRETVPDGHIRVSRWRHKRLDAELERASNGKKKPAFPNQKFSIRGTEPPVKQSRSDRGSSTQARARASPTTTTIQDSPRSPPNGGAPPPPVVGKEGEGKKQRSRSRGGWEGMARKEWRQ